SSSMLMGCTLPAFVPPPSPPGGGVNGNCGFCSSAMFFSHSNLTIFTHTTSTSGRLRGPAEMSAKYLHLHEVMCQRITGNYSTEACPVELTWKLVRNRQSRSVSKLVIG